MKLECWHLVLSAKVHVGNYAFTGCSNLELLKERPSKKNKFISPLVSNIKQQDLGKEG